MSGWLDWEFSLKGDAPKRFKQKVEVLGRTLGSGHAYEPIDVQDGKSVLGYLWDGLTSTDHQKLFVKFLARFGRNKIVRRPYGMVEVYEINYKLLLVGYQLIKRSFQQFSQILKTAKDEEEFYTLAGMS